MNIGSTNTTSEVFVETVTEDDESDNDESMEVKDASLGDDHTIDYEDWVFDMKDLDAFMASAASAGKAKVNLTAGNQIFWIKT